MKLLALIIGMFVPSVMADLFLGAEISSSCSTNRSNIIQSGALRLEDDENIFTFLSFGYESVFIIACEGETTKLLQTLSQHLNEDDAIEQMRQLKLVLEEKYGEPRFYSEEKDFGSASWSFDDASLNLNRMKTPDYWSVGYRIKSYE